MNIIELFYALCQTRACSFRSFSNQSKKIGAGGFKGGLLKTQREARTGVMKRTREKKDSEKTELKPTISISPDFMLNSMEFSREAQKRIFEWFGKFAKNPMSPGINYETSGRIP